jgi:hypothetical protein
MKRSLFIILALVLTSCSSINSERSIASVKSENAKALALEKIREGIDKKRTDLMLAKYNIVSLLDLMEEEEKKARHRFYKSAFIDGALGLNLAFYGAGAAIHAYHSVSSSLTTTAISGATAAALGFGSYKFYQRIKMNYTVAKEYSKTLEELLSQIDKSDLVNKLIKESEDEEFSKLIKDSYANLLYESKSLRGEIEISDKSSLIVIPAGAIAARFALFFRNYAAAFASNSFADKLAGLGIDASLIGLVVAPLKLVFDNADKKFQLSRNTIQRFREAFAQSLERIENRESELEELEKQMESY